MNEIRLTRGFLKRPINSVILILIIMLIAEALSWSMNYQIKSKKVEYAGGLLDYFSLIIRITFVPEVVSAIVIMVVINLIHRWFKIRTIATDWLAVVKYELSFLPVLIFVYFLFIPFTQSVRYVFAKAPTYSFSDYWNNYILISYTWRIYFIYLLPVLLLGYCMLNISLLIDYVKQERT